VALAVKEMRPATAGAVADLLEYTLAPKAAAEGETPAFPSCGRGGGEAARRRRCGGGSRGPPGGTCGRRSVGSGDGPGCRRPMIQSIRDAGSHGLVRGVPAAARAAPGGDHEHPRVEEAEPGTCEPLTRFASPISGVMAGFLGRLLAEHGPRCAGAPASCSPASPQPDAAALARGDRRLFGNTPLRKVDVSMPRESGENAPVPRPGEGAAGDPGPRRWLPVQIILDDRAAGTAGASVAARPPCHRSSGKDHAVRQGVRDGASA